MGEDTGRLGVGGSGAGTWNRGVAFSEKLEKGPEVMLTIELRISGVLGV